MEQLSDSLFDGGECFSDLESDHVVSCSDEEDVEDEEELEEFDCDLLVYVLRKHMNCVQSAEALDEYHYGDNLTLRELRQILFNCEGNATPNIDEIV